MKKYGIAMMRAIVVAAVVSGAGLMLAPAKVLAVDCPSGSVNSSADTLADCNVEQPTQGDNDLISSVGNILNVAIGIIGLLAVVLIIVAGFSYITSAGDAAKIARAKNILIYSVVGLIIVLLAFAIVNFVINKVTS